MKKRSSKVELKKAWKEQQRQKLLDSIPIPNQQFRSLFDYLENEGVDQCDHTLRITTKFLQLNECNVETVLTWLREHGGYCDCEVLANVGSEFDGFLDNE